MKLFVCTKLSAWATEICCVIADNPEHCMDILKNDGRQFFEIEAYYSLSEEIYQLKDSGIDFSLSVDNDAYEG